MLKYFEGCPIPAKPGEGRGGSSQKKRASIETLYSYLSDYIKYAPGSFYPIQI